MLLWHFKCEFNITCLEVCLNFDPLPAVLAHSSCAVTMNTLVFRIIHCCPCMMLHRSGITMLRDQTTEMSSTKANNGRLKPKLWTEIPSLRLYVPFDAKG